MRSPVFSRRPCSAASLKAPGTEGVEALRQALQNALENHDDKEQCELFSPALLASSGSISACEKELSTEPGPYSHRLENYVAGGRIALTDNRAEYQRHLLSGRLVGC
jgi:hypothetical protein